MSSHSLWLGAAFAMVCVATLLAYAPSFGVPFQFDDYARILENVNLEKGKLLAAVAWLGNSRFIPALTLALNYVISGDVTFAYHVVNFAVHLLASLGVFQLALALCRTPRMRNTWLGYQRLVFATGATLLFACHPIQTQAVTYIVQRFASMAAMFYIWSIVLYVRARNRGLHSEGHTARGLYIGAVLLAVCALLSKENAASIPLVVLLTEWVFYPGRRNMRLAIGIGVAALVVLAILLAWKVLTWHPSGASTSSWVERAVRAVLAQGAPAGHHVSPTEYFLTQCTVLPRYLALVFLPWGLNVDPDVPVARGLTLSVAGGFALMAALLAAGFTAVRRWPLIGFGMLWFFVAMSIESSFLPITDVMMEHRMYLAMPGISLAIGGALAWLFQVRPRVATAAGVSVAIALVVLTFARNQVWQTPLTLWSDAAAKSPGKARVHVNLGVAYHGVGRLDDAVQHYCRAIEIKPNIALVRDNLEIALDAQGRFEEVVEQIMLEGKPASGGPPGALLVEFDVAKAVCP